MSAEEPTPARPGTPADLSRRMDRMEAAHETLAKEVGGLTTTIARVEINQTHAEELNKLRFDSVAGSITQVEGKLDRYMAKLNEFITRIEKVMTGEIETQQSRQGQAMVVDYQKWRQQTDDRLDNFEILSTQVKFLGKIILVFTGSSVLVTLAALYTAFVK